MKKSFGDDNSRNDGGSNKLSSNESAKFVKYFIKRVNNRVPVVVGVSDAGLQNLVCLSQLSMDLGAAGVMVAPISGLNTEKKLYEYFVQVFDALGPDIPVCYQDYPQSTGHVDCFNRLVKEFSTISYAKLSRARETNTSPRYFKI